MHLQVGCLLDEKWRHALPALRALTRRFVVLRYLLLFVDWSYLLSFSLTLALLLAHRRPAR